MDDNLNPNGSTGTNPTEPNKPAGPMGGDVSKPAEPSKPAAPVQMPNPTPSTPPVVPAASTTPQSVTVAGMKMSKSLMMILVASGALLVVAVGLWLFLG